MKTQTPSSSTGSKLRQAKRDEGSAAALLPRIEHAQLQNQLVDINALRRARIAEGAYYRAEKRGFAPGYEVEDWLAAELEVDEKSRQL